MRYGLSLLEVEKPGRYEGRESGAVLKDWSSARLRVALCFPDVYEIGMSHLGLPILYHALNRKDGVLAERAFAPWMDMESLLRRKAWPLVTRESGHPLSEFDLVGFTLQYELCATNVLAMIELGGIPLLARDRRAEDPIVIGGGPAAANPEPFADFFDAFFIGEGEEAIDEIAEALLGSKGAGLGRPSRLEGLRRVEGVYVPSQTTPRFEGKRLAGFDPPTRVRRRIVADLEGTSYPERPLVPFVSTVHDRLAAELARGCTRGCRFCQAGFLYRPVRERSPETVEGSVKRGLACSGYDEVGLLSLSTGDYSSIGPLLVHLMDAHAEDRVSVSLPSLRVDSLEPLLLEEVKRVRKTGFTLAPEAGTERLRKVINKNITEDDVLDAVGRIFSAGWKGVKLYFMVGLPFETRQDWEGIVDLVHKVVRSVPKGRGRVGVSISNFVPKAHTPFQWSRQIGPEEIREAQEFFRRKLKHKRVDLKLHDAHMSLLEGVHARADRRLGATILSAYRKGCRMDGWTDQLRWDLWEEAFAETGFSPEEFVRERGVDEVLPWDVVDVGVDRGYLLREWQKAQDGQTTEDCRGGECQGCGLCDFEVLMPRVCGPRDYRPGASTACPRETGTDLSHLPRVRFRFSKTGPASLLSHLETVTALHRAFRAAGVRLVYSQGYHPHPKLTLGPAMPLGVESLAELGDMRVWETPPLAATQRRIADHLPEGLRVEAMWLLPGETKALTGGSTREEYRVQPSPEAASKVSALGGWQSIIEAFWNAPRFPVTKRRKNKADRVLDARQFAEALWLNGDDIVVRLRRKPDGTTIAPEAFLHRLSDLPEGVRACARVLKTRSELL